MLTLYLGGTEITQAITIKRKTTIVTRTIGDFVAQSSTINNAQMLNIMNATKAVVSPYAQGNLKIVVTSVGIDAANNATVVWSDATANGTAKTPGTSVTLPTGTQCLPEHHRDLDRGRVRVHSVRRLVDHGQHDPRRSHVHASASRREGLPRYRRRHAGLLNAKSR